MPQKPNTEKPEKSEIPEYPFKKTAHRGEGSRRKKQTQARMNFLDTIKKTLTLLEEDNTDFRNALTLVIEELYSLLDASGLSKYALQITLLPSGLVIGIRPGTDDETLSRATERLNQIAHTFKERIEARKAKSEKK